MEENILKITDVEIGYISVPLKRPFKTAIRTVTSVEDIIVMIKTDCGALHLKLHHGTVLIQTILSI
ncbi:MULTISPECIES: hypothetical protein [Clostridium]|uniref:hypothetical protein n=1 Tax=Clostridium TaxID=1485 RepID=UPI0038B231D6